MHLGYSWVITEGKMRKGDGMAQSMGQCLTTAGSSLSPYSVHTLYLDLLKRINVITNCQRGDLCSAVPAGRDLAKNGFGQVCML